MKKTWAGKTNPTILPPESYWAYLARTFQNSVQVQSLRDQSNRRLTEFTAVALDGPENSATALLEQVTQDGWLTKEIRYTCLNCNEPLDSTSANLSHCPACHASFSKSDEIIKEIVFTRRLPPVRPVDWVVVIHGMNTHGAWQETFTWLIGTTSGKSVPLAVYKYGRIVTGVLHSFRRRSLQTDFRNKLATLQAEAGKQGYTGKPDVIAHSFGTWLLGHLMQDELDRPLGERLQFGRIILTGSVLRPDFDWKTIKDAGIVEEVLNHFGTQDGTVPFAHATILDSGPSGRIGFDGNDIINVPATGYGHSDFFEIDKGITDGVIRRSTSTHEFTLLENCYENVWKPFLTLPSSELDQFPNRTIRPSKWKPLRWALRGTIFPWMILPLVASLILLALIGLGTLARWFHLQAVALPIAKFTGAGVTTLVASIGIVFLWRRLLSQKSKE